ncbi:hypothetical protein Nepgr_012141 [Nepenthes gracilis]|uniref:Uncharacterized protein n=1 Tax=Nepenthes gracilis TaxID=150966 RepID=A0AAD3SGE7_NEPGR|nr:hypothetical protein Nepgr_012141 [Nepenthes gracilis]
MDRYVVIDSSQNPKSILRPRWKRTSVELNGRFESKYRHDMSTLLVQSYSEVVT